MLDIQKLTEFRRDLHQHPESSFQEHRTQQQIINYLKELDVKDEQIIPAAKTGLFVNLVGQADPEGEDRQIAFRADIDALIIQEQNQHLPYRSINNCAHMCGHDGHTTMLLGFASLFQQKRNEIPKNKKVRLLFQPAEENFGGSVDMIKEGCLDDVNEVYGCHQWPTGKIGQVWVTEGPMMSEPVMMKLEITGKGGHASEPHKFKNPTTCGAEFICTVNNELSQIKRNFTFAWTCFNAGTATNIIPDSAVLAGQIRSLEVGLGQELFEKTKQIAQTIGDKYGCQVNLDRYNENYPLTANTQKEGNHVLRLGKQFFGEGNSHSGPCPVYASEDFGNYTLKVPGAFFFLSSGKKYLNLQFIVMKVTPYCIRVILTSMMIQQILVPDSGCYQQRIVYICEIMNLYGIYNQLSNFLEDGSPRQPESQLGTKINEIKQKIFTRPPEPSENVQQQNTFWDKVEKKFDELRRPSPIRQQNVQPMRQPSPITIQNSTRDNKRKIFEQSQPESIPSRKQWEPKLNDSISDSFTSQSIRSIENENTNVDEMYYKENNQEQILSVLIKKLGPNEKQNNLHQMNQKLGFLLENLTKKEKNAVKQLTINLLAHQNELNRAQSNYDQMVNRFNQCFRRVQVARQDLQKLKKTHCELGIGIQNKLRRKKEIELQIQNIRTFCLQHQNVKDLIEQLNHQNIEKQQWPLRKVLQIKDEVWKASKQNTNMRFYTCFNDIRGHIEGLFQQQLDFSFRFFTQNIIEVSLQYQNEQIFQILDNICDYLVQYELNNKQVDISKHIKSSIQAQFRSILRQSGTWNKKIERQRNIKFDSIKNLNQYLNAFFISFYKTSYGLNRIVYIFQQLAGNNKLQDKQKCQLYKKVSFQFGIEKNQFWIYIQEKIIKTLKRTKLDAPNNSNDWQRLEFILYRVIQIGEELSNLKSDNILSHISNQLQNIAIGISKSVYQCLSQQKGVGMIKIQSANYEMTLFKRIEDFKKRKRIDSKSGYLQQYLNAKEIIKEPQLQILPTAENQIYTKKEEYYFIISQLQEFILYGQSVPHLQLDCFIYSLQCTQFYSYLLMIQNLGNHLKQLIIDIQLDKYKDQVEFTQLIQAHDWVCEYGKLQNLRQMIAQQYDAVKSYGMNVEVQYIASSLREIIENLNLLQKIHDYIQTEFKPQIPEDKELFNSYLRKQQDLIGEIIFLWIFQQGLKDIQIDGTQLQSYQLISKLNQVIHQIQKSNQVIESKISTETLVNIYLQSFNRQLAITLSKVIEKTNKLQIIAELKNFFKLNPYKSKFDSLETILEVKNQSQIFDAMIKAKDIPLSLQMQILQREFNLSCVYIRKFYENYYNYIIDIL